MTEETQLTEVDIEIKQNGAYNNIEPKYQLKDGEFLVVEKGEFKEAKTHSSKHGVSGIVSCIYKDTNVTFFVKERDIAAWNNSGDTGDKVRIVAKASGYFVPSGKNAGKEVMYLNFERVD